MVVAFCRRLFFSPDGITSSFPAELLTEAASGAFFVGFCAGLVVGRAVLAEADVLAVVVVAVVVEVVNVADVVVVVLASCVVVVTVPAVVVVVGVGVTVPPRALDRPVSSVS